MSKALYSLIFAVLFLSVGIFAKDGQDGSQGSISDEDSNKGEDQTEDDRSLSVKSNDGKKFEFESELKGDTTRDKLQFSIDTQDNGLELRIDFFSKSADTKSQERLRVEFSQVVEYLEDGKSAGYQKGEEVAVIDFDNNKVAWNNIVCTQNGTNYDCSVSTADGQFGAAFHLVGVLSDVNGVPVKPSSVKIDVHINKNNRQTGTSMAVVLKSKSVSKQSLRSTSTEQDENFAKEQEKQISFGNNGFFSWALTAQCNGKTVNVINGDLEDSSANDLEKDESCKAVVFSFDTTDIAPIIWDPKLAWDSPAMIAIPSMIVMLAAILALLL